MSLQIYPYKNTEKRRKNLWFERLMAIAATANLALVVFDLTYVSWRNFWLQGNIVIPFTAQRIQVPLPTTTCRDRSVEAGQPEQQIRQSAIVCLYDPVKGIEPHRETEFYLKTVEQLELQRSQQEPGTGLQSTEVQTTLRQLRQLSADMISSNPFEAAGKTGTLERIKNEMRRHVRRRINANVSSTEAFEIFWSTDNPKFPNYLSATSWNREIQWFNSTIRPLIETNYYRTISETGGPTNRFWVLDAPFIILFTLEFLARTFYISRRYTSLTWLDAMIWRWYDLPLLIPFSLFVPFLALTRVIPTALRLHQAEIIDLDSVNEKAREGFVAAIAEEITEVVVVQVVNQMQLFIRRGELSQLLKRTTNRRYIDINNVNEIEAISKHLTQLVVYQVFPKVRPDLEALLRHSIHSTLSQSPAYRGVTSLPGIGEVPAQITERIVSDIVQSLYDSLKNGLEDPKMAELTTRLVQNFTNTFTSEAQQEHNLEEIQILLSDLLEEIKINYVQRISEEDATLILDQTRQMKRSHQE